MQEELIMAVTTTINKFATNLSAKGKGVLSTAASGIGTDMLMRTIDNVVGSPVQRIASFNLPVIGTVGPIDVLNYSVHAGGFKVSKNGLIAVLAAKIASGVLPSIGPIRLPQTTANASGGSTPAGTGTGATF